MHWQDSSRHMPEPQNDGQLKQIAINAFKDFDVDKGGYLDLHEFMDALRALRLTITYHEAIDCFLRCDENEDGRITEAEFTKIYIDEHKTRPYHLYAQQPQPPQNPSMRP